MDRIADIDWYQVRLLNLAASERQHRKGSIVLEPCWFEGFYVKFSRYGQRVHPRAVIGAFDTGPSHPVTCIRAATGQAHARNGERPLPSWIRAASEFLVTSLKSAESGPFGERCSFRPCSKRRRNLLQPHQAVFPSISISQPPKQFILSLSKRI